MLLSPSSSLRFHFKEETDISGNFNKFFWKNIRALVHLCFAVSKLSSSKTQVSRAWMFFQKNLLNRNTEVNMFSLTYSNWLFSGIYSYFLYTFSVHYSNFWAKLTKHYTLGLFFPSKMRKLRKTLLDYDFLRWLGSPLNITVRIWVAPFPQHWSLCTIWDFGLNCPLFIFRASDWSQFDTGAKRFDTKRLPTQIELHFVQPHWKPPTYQLP